jgi:hypothetical protein
VKNKDWRDQFESIRQNPPHKTGDLITTVDGSPIAIHLSFPEGKMPFFYGVLHLTAICGQDIGWHARSINDLSKERYEGHKLVLMSRSRSLLIRIYGVKMDTIPVAALRVHHVSESGKSIVVELTPEVKASLEAKLLRTAMRGVEA